MQLTISIPDEAEMMIKEGESVTIGAPLYTIVKQQIITVPVASDLGVKPNDIFGSLTKVIGDSVAAGETLGHKKRFLSKKTSVSPQEGIIKTIDHEAGTVHIEVNANEKNQFPAFFSGKMVKFDKRTNLLTIDLEGGAEFKLQSASDFGGGPLKTITDEDFFTLEEETVKDSIIMLESVMGHIAAKLDALGAAGVIYIKGEPGSLSFGKLENSEDLKKIIDSQPRFIVFSGYAKKAVVYS